MRAAYCSFRDCTKERAAGTLFCRFHMGEDVSTGPALDKHGLGAMRAIERVLRQQPEDARTKRYALAVADVLTRWFGDEAKLIAAEATRILEAMR